MAEPLSQARLLQFWTPLALTWAIMGVEIPVISLAVARLPEATANLAALGAAIAIAWFSETLITNLTAISLRLARDRASYAVVRRYAVVLICIASGANCLLILSPAFGWMLEHGLGLEPDLARRTTAAYEWLLVWPAAIGVRRFYQGQLIRHGLTRRVAYGTGVRLVVIALGALAAAWTGALPGAEAGAAILAAAVVAEAVAAWLMAASAVRTTNATDPVEAPPTLVAFWRFYWPLTVMMGLNLGVGALVTVGLARSHDAIIALAAFPVAHGLNFIARATVTSYQEAVIALLGEAESHGRALRWFALKLGGAATAALALIAVTPAASWLFLGLMDLPERLIEPAREAFLALLFYPAVTLWFVWSRARLTHLRHTRPIATATLLETVLLALAMAAMVGPLDLPGATAAGLAMTGSRLIANIWLEYAARDRFRALAR